MGKIAQIDQLVSSGLAPVKKLPYARIVMSDVDAGITNMNYRNLAIRIWSRISNFLLTDQVLFNRLRQLLLQSHESVNILEFLDEELQNADTSGSNSFNDIEVPNSRRTLRTVKRIVKNDFKKVSKSH